MGPIDQLVQAALQRDNLLLRGLVQDLLYARIDWSRILRPETDDTCRLVLAAALVELLATRQNQVPPAWTAEFGALPEPFYLVRAAWVRS